MASRIVDILVNGAAKELLVKPGTTLLAVLRDQLGMTATKRGCEEGSCGACTVIVDGMAVRSCLLPVETISGADVRTLEGLAPGGALSPLQEAMLDGFATQCGFCNAGVLMTATALLEENPSPTEDDVIRAISGNVCRCTGYHPIIQAILAAAKNMRAAETQAAE
jgi:carbon-monoxide dehydrogenase small subunit